MDAMESLWTTDEVATFLKVDVVTVRRLVTRGELAAYRIGGEYRFAREDLQEFLGRQHVPARATRGASSAVERQHDALPQPAEAQAGGPDRAGLTGAAQRSLELAAEAARASGRGYLGTEHLLLGLAAEREGAAAQVLEALGITVEEMRDAMAGAEDWPERASSGAGLSQLPLTSQAQRAIDMAAAQAAEWEHDVVDTEHLLYGLALAADGNIALLLEILGTAPDMVQAEVLRRVREGGEERSL
ncbi:MAG: hypothetical protein RLZZ387_1148 [Chloroflexota bacterium]|jgi:excisionase family DNA binding protein